MTLEAFEGMTDGLIALTAGYEGAVARLLDEDQERAAEDYLARLEGLFPGRLYVELTRIGDAAEAKVEPLLIELAHRRDVPLVATNPVLYEAHDFHAAHDAMLCIADSTYVDEPNRRRSNPETWFKSPRQMEKLFQDVPEALANTTVIARRCAVAAPSRKPPAGQQRSTQGERGAAKLAPQPVEARHLTCSTHHRTARRLALRLLPRQRVEQFCPQLRQAVRASR